MKKLLKIITIIILFLLSLSIFRRLKNLIGRRSKTMAKPA